VLSRTLTIASEATAGDPGAGRKERFVVRSPGRVTILRMEEVEWLEAAGNTVRIHAGSGVYRTRNTMAALEQQLDPDRFARIHRSTVVNLEHVREVLVASNGDYWVLTGRGQRLTVGRSYRDRINRFVESTAMVR
jgi:two-component system, LytTR family, response regulator